jgi:hypothetical protein
MEKYTTYTEEEGTWESNPKDKGNQGLDQIKYRRGVKNRISIKNKNVITY